jgi:hypothetical protein
MKAARLRSDHVVRKGAAARRLSAPPKVVRLEDAEGWARGSAKPPVAAKQTPQARGSDAATANPGDRRNNGVRLSLRLDGEVHRRLKLVAACRQESVQEVLASAVERYLRDIGPETLTQLTALLAADHGEES